MADTIKISALPAVTVPDATSVAPVVQGGVTKKQTNAQTVAGGAVSPSNMIYVAANGTNATGNGKLFAPYLTTKYATDNSTTGDIFVNTGSFASTGLTLKPGLNLSGNDRTSTLLSDTTNLITLDASWIDNDSISAISNVTLVNTGLSFDFEAVAGTGSVHVDNCQISAGVSVTGRSSGNTAFTASNTDIVSDATFSGIFLIPKLINTRVRDVIFGLVNSGQLLEGSCRNLVMGFAGAGSANYRVINSSVTNNASLTSSGGGSASATVYGTPIEGTFTITGTLSTLIIDTESYPQNGFVFAGGASISNVTIQPNGKANSGANSDITSMTGLTGVIATPTAVLIKNVVANTGASYTISHADGSVFDLTMNSATPTLTLTTVPDSPQSVILFVNLIQDGGGTRVPTFANVTYASGIPPYIRLAGDEQTEFMIIASNGVWTLFELNRPYFPVVDISGTTKTLALTDSFTMQTTSSASATTITVPPQADVVWTDNVEIEIFWNGAGQPAFAAGAGVTILSSFSNLKIAARYSGATLKRFIPDTWMLTGNLAP